MLAAVAPAATASNLLSAVATLCMDCKQHAATTAAWRAPCAGEGQQAVHMHQKVHDAFWKPWVCYSEA